MIGTTSPVEQRQQRVARVQIALAIGQVRARQQRLRDDDPFAGKQLIPLLHQLGLAHGGQHLLERDVLAVLRDRAAPPPGDDRAGRHERHLMAVAHQPATCRSHTQHLRTRQSVLAPGQRVGADLDDQALSFMGSQQVLRPELIIWAISTIIRYASHIRSSTKERGMSRKLWLSAYCSARRCLCRCADTAPRTANGAPTAASPEARNTRRSIKSTKRTRRRLRIAWRFKTDNLGPRPDFNMQADADRW